MPHSQPDMGQKNNPKSKTLNPKVTVLGHAANTKSTDPPVIGVALNSLASSCPRPCMAIIASLWARRKKIPVFHHNSDVLVQLSSSHIYSNGCVGALLGHGFSSHFSGGISPVALGNLYLRDESVSVYQRCYVHDRRKCLYSNSRC
uniref:Uncharacterized protein n=1 Tax=Quercus lobata TaxID=97700 RepID=A0A7N2MMC7_QUELO